MTSPHLPPGSRMLSPYALINPAAPIVQSPPPTIEERILASIKITSVTLPPPYSPEPNSFYDVILHCSNGDVNTERNLLKKNSKFFDPLIRKETNSLRFEKYSKEAISTCLKLLEQSSPFKYDVLKTLEIPQKIQAARFFHECRMERQFSSLFSVLCEDPCQEMFDLDAELSMEMHSRLLKEWIRSLMEKEMAPILTSSKLYLELSDLIFQVIDGQQSEKLGFLFAQNFRESKLSPKIFLEITSKLTPYSAYLLFMDLEDEKLKLEVIRRTVYYRQILVASKFKNQEHKRSIAEVLKNCDEKIKRYRTTEKQ